jgi:pimeloyl-ACP methyl ester carboxylesterase
LIHTLAWLLGSLLVAGVLGAFYQIWATRRDRRLYPPPGRLVDVGGHRLHIHESGQDNGPTILLEAGLMSTVLSWSGLHEELAKSHRVVSYDRAGLGWSDLGPMPRTAERIVEELQTLLQKARVPGPYVLVGHSFAGLTIPLFAARFPDQVAGVVLVDPVAPVEWNPPSESDSKQIRIGAKVCRRSALLARLGVIRLIAWLLAGGGKKIASHLVRVISRGTPQDSGTVSSPWFAALPESERTMAALFWVHQKFALTIASQLENLPANAALVEQLGVYCEKPVIILSARTAPEHRQREHLAIASRLPLGEHILAEGSNHWIMQAGPELVIGAIESVVARYRASPDQAAKREPLATSFAAG